jgi:hypothetical protein
LPSHILIAALSLTCAGCGYLGDPLPPLANIPPRIADLAAIQRGSHVIVQFTVPTKTTEGHPIPQPLKLDLRAGTAAEPFDEDQWATAARQVPEPPLSGPVARYEIPVAEWTGKDLIIAVRPIAGNGKHAQWSELLVVPIVPAPETPRSVSATAVASGVRLTWQAHGPSFRVFRKSASPGQSQDFALLATVEKPEWADTTAEFDQPYVYLVQTVAALPNHKVAESDLSAEVPITPHDTFPPATPTNLQPSLAPNSIELSWDANSEPDLAGYRVYRASTRGDFVKLADVSAIPSYSDRSAVHGQTYRYSITAFDRAGNESARSAPIEILLP